MPVVPATDPAASNRPGWFRPFKVSRFGVLLDTVTGDPWKRLTDLGTLVWPNGGDVDPEAALPSWPIGARPALTEVQGAYDATRLYLRVICDEPEAGRARLDSPDFWRNDHVAICLDPRHDHWRYWQIMVLPDGRSEACWNTVHFGHVPADLAAKREPAAGHEASVRVERLADRWIAEVTIHLRAVGVSNATRGQCLGLNVNRLRTAGCEQFMQWSPTFGLPADARCFGDLYLGQPAAILQEIDLGGPCWGPNRGHARFVASRPFRAWIERGEGIEPAEEVPQVLQAGTLGNAVYRLDYRVDPREIMEGRLTLRWSGADAPAERAASSSASFVLGWKRSGLLTHAVGREGKPERPRDGRATDFFARMCDYLLARLPGLRREGGRYLVERRTPREGGAGPSNPPPDAHGLPGATRPKWPGGPEGGAHISRCAGPVAGDDGPRTDLLSDDPLGPMAEAIAGRIDGMDDQLAACAMILCQKDVLISSGALARVTHATNAASMLWAGGTFCDGYSMVLAALVDRLAALQNWNIRTGLVYMLRPEGAPEYWPNHYWAGVWLDRGVTILDAELGRFFYRADGGQLATLDDLFEDPSLAEAAGTGMGCYFRLHGPEDVSVRQLACWRDTRPG